MGVFRQFRLLFWKNWLLQKRSPWLTLFEIGLPTLFAVILVLIRQQSHVTNYTSPRNWSAISAKIPGSFQTLAYTPGNNTVVQSIVKTVQRDLFWQEVKGFDTEDDMIAFLRDDTLNNWGGLVFTNDFSEDGSFPEKIEYKLRPLSWKNSLLQQATIVNWFTNLYYPTFQMPGPRQKESDSGGEPDYYSSHFISLQGSVDRAILAVLGETNVQETIDFYLERFPYPPYRDDVFVFVIQIQFPFIILLSFIVTAPSISKDIVLEKERKLKEFMKMMGLPGWLHWAAWFLKYLIFMLISVLIMTIMFCVPMGPAAVINNADPTLVFVFFMLYAIATIMFCFAVSVFFKKANSGAAAGGIAFFITYIPNFFIQMRYQDVNGPTKWATSILHNVAMSYGCTQIAAYEGAGSGLQWNNFYKPVSVDENFTMADVFLMLVVDIVFYGIIVWYFDNTMPGDYGIPKPWYFPFTKTYWCGTSLDVCVDISPSIEDHVDLDYFELEDDTGIDTGIKIRNLRKKYDTAKRAAVKGMYLNINEGQITALLGHNGAGKTTTMSMLTGFLPPTSGTAYINGLDINKDIDAIRRAIGLCPQHNILFDNLTVKEHLVFYSSLKYEGGDVDKEVSDMIGLLHLDDKTNAKSKGLSGGMKRKLHCGIALAGGSKIVMLDEPTSGMDPEARRQMWDILQSQREGRTMVLSTHFMDEADLLGDRIAIMADGQVKCYGSSLFLKNKYGVGYHMVMVKEEECDVKKVKDAIRSYVPDAQLESNVSAELSFILPTESVAHFEDMFTYLEENKSQLGIASFGASVTTMEEVFLKVGEEVENEENSTEEMVEHPAITVTTYGSDGTTNGMAGTHPGNKDGVDNKGFAGDDVSAYQTTDIDTSEGSDYLSDADETDTPGQFEDNEFNERGGVFTITEGCDTAAIVEQRPSQIRRQSSILSNGRLERALSIENRWHLTPVMGQDLMKNSGLALYWQQFTAMFYKRVLHTWRNRLVTVTQILLPLIFLILSCISIKTIPKQGDPPPISLSLDAFTEQHVPFVTYSPPSSGTVSLLAKSLEEALHVDKFDNVNELRPNDPDIVAYIGDIGLHSLDDYNRKYTVAAEFKGKPNDRVTYTTFFNAQGYHSIAVAMNTVGNTLLKAYLNNNNSHSIHVSNHPVPLSESLKVLQDVTSSSIMGFTISSNILFGMSFLVGTFVLFLIKERTTKAKHIQFVSGVHQVNYWFSTFCWDLINYLFASFLIVPVFAAFNIEPYIVGSNSGFVFLTLFLYGWSVLPFTYLFSHLFEVPASGYVWTVVFNMFTGIAAVMAVFILRLPILDTEDIAKGLEWAFYVLLPNFCFGNALQDMYTNHENKKVCEPYDQILPIFCNTTLGASNPCCPGTCGKDNGFCATYQDNYLAWAYPGIGRAVTFMAIQGVVFLTLLLIGESGTVQSLFQMAVESTNYTTPTDECPETDVTEDNDVTTERLRVLNTAISPMETQDSLILQELRKWYGSFLAVDRLTVGIPQGECFGLLGVNGAGKTSTFKMLTGDNTISSGDAYLYGYSVKNYIKEVQSHLGYCPQFDALIDQMTVRETLMMFGHLRGVHEDVLPRTVDGIVDALLLRDHVDKQTRELSGGNKRKLSTGVALIGDPPVIFLDEPTTGMDPVARRRLWNTLSHVRASGRTLVLTSHSMEECEALCTRMAIMVNGQFKCLGSTQHLKTKFGEGYTLLAKIVSSETADLETNTRTAMSFIENAFPGSVLKDIHQGYLHYQIPAYGVTWATLFGTMENNRKAFHIEDYSVSQTTLEQVFINFARAQRPPLEGAQKCITQCGNCCRFFFCGGCCDEPNYGHKETTATHI